MERIIIGHNSGNHVLDLGGGDNDLLAGGDGDDTLGGGDGNDTLHGGAGDDLLIFNSGGLDFSGDDGTDTLRILSGFSFDGLEITVDKGIEILDLEDGVLRGNDLANTFDLRGLSAITGGDRIELRRGNDAFFGSGQAESIEGDSGDDSVEAGGGNDTVSGGGGADLINGGIGNDTMTGGAGNDILHGGFGSDTLTGNQGADTFIFNATDGHDVIREFQDNIDSIDLNNQNFTLMVDNGNAVLTFDADNSLTVDGNFANVAQAQSILSDDFI